MHLTIDTNQFDVHNVMISDKTKNNIMSNSCSICGEDIDNKYKFTTECNHTFHYECLMNSFIYQKKKSVGPSKRETRYFRNTRKCRYKRSR